MVAGDGRDTCAWVLSADGDLLGSLVVGLA